MSGPMSRRRRTTIATPKGSQKPRRGLSMRFVEVKTQAQLDMQTLHRSRDRLVGERTALINQLRAILLERGIVVPEGKRKLERFLVALMGEQDGSALTARMRMLVADMQAQWQELDRRIAAFEAEF